MKQLYAHFLQPVVQCFPVLHTHGLDFINSIFLDSTWFLRIYNPLWSVGQSCRNSISVVYLAIFFVSKSWGVTEHVVNVYVTDESND